MHRTRVKICGITRVEDALAAADAGADAIGLVFHPPAPRCISQERAAQILAALPPFVTPVGLFVDRPAAEVLAAAASLRLRHVQLHGREEPAVIAGLPGLIVLKALRVARQTFPADLHAWRLSIEHGRLTHLRGFVLETAGGKQAGGTGVENDWSAIREARDAGAFIGLPPIIAAGGLHAGNVGRVVSELAPWAVDVSSGVESSPGIKSAEKIWEFIRAVREADEAMRIV